MFTFIIFSIILFCFKKGKKSSNDVKILIAQVREKIYYSLEIHSLLLREEKGCFKGTRDTSNLLYKGSSKISKPHPNFKFVTHPSHLYGHRN